MSYLHDIANGCERGEGSTVQESRPGSALSRAELARLLIDASAHLAAARGELDGLRAERDALREKVTFTEDMMLNAVAAQADLTRAVEAERDALAERLDRQVAMWGDLSATFAAKAMAWREDAERLYPYTRHDDECPSRFTGDADCNCGYLDALSGHRAALAAPHDFKDVAADVLIALGLPPDAPVGAVRQAWEQHQAIEAAAIVNYTDQSVVAMGNKETLLASKLLTWLRAVGSVRSTE